VSNLALGVAVDEVADVAFTLMLFASLA